jgi:uncharacterized protein (TIGR03435 family)
MGAFMSGGPGSGDPGRITYHSTPWQALLQRAFGVHIDQLACPGWMTGGLYFYDIHATIPPGATEQQFQMMLQDLLADRFRLVYHRDRKLFPGYELTVAPGGPRIRPSDTQADSLDDSHASRGSIKKGGQASSGFPVLEPGRKFKVKSPPLSESGIIRATFHETIPEFVEYLPYMIMASNRETGYPRYRVANRTGLEGVFDFTLEFFGGATLDGGGPSIFRALERQVGLRLNKTSDVEVEMIVVDSAERIPTEN